MKFSKSWKVNSGRSSRGTYSFITFSKFNLQPGFVPSLFFNDQWNHSQPCGLRLQSCANWTWFRHLILFSSSEFCLGNILMKPPDTVWMLRGLSPRFYELEEESSSPSGRWSNDTGDLSPRSWTWWSLVLWPLSLCWSCCFFCRSCRSWWWSCWWCSLWWSSCWQSWKLSWAPWPAVV